MLAPFRSANQGRTQVLCVIYVHQLHPFFETDSVNAGRACPYLRKYPALAVSWKTYAGCSARAGAEGLGTAPALVLAPKATSLPPSTRSLNSNQTNARAMLPPLHKSISTRASSPSSKVNTGPFRISTCAEQSRACARSITRSRCGPFPAPRAAWGKRNHRQPRFSRRGLLAMATAAARFQQVIVAAHKIEGGAGGKGFAGDYVAPPDVILGTARTMSG